MDKDPKEIQPFIYYDFTTQERDSALRYLLDAILKVRSKNIVTSKHKVFDEDVNVYLAHLLFATSLPEYYEMSEPYLSQDSSDVLNWAKQTQDKTLRYFIYKVNADYLLIHTSIFNDIRMKHKTKFFRKSEEYYRELAVLYYEQASRCHKTMYRKKTGIGEVLQKVSNDYGYYQAIMNLVKDEYFYFVDSFKDYGFRTFLDGMKKYEEEKVYDEKLDEFLSIYHDWMSQPTEDNRREMLRLCEELKALNSDFFFDISKIQDPPEDFRKAA